MWYNMNMEEKTGWQGLYTVRVGDRVSYYENVVTKVFREELNKMFDGTRTAPLRIVKQQLGTGTATATTDDEDLDNAEANTLKTISNTYVDGITLGINATWGFGEAEGSWTEFALWAAEDVNDSNRILAVRMNIDEFVPNNSSIVIDGTIKQNHNED